MTNAELVKALRYCANENNVCTEIENCGYYGNGFFCSDTMMRAAADALEADEKRIKELEMSFSDVCNANGSLACERNKLLNDVRELEAQLPKEGEWLRTDAFPHRVYCSCCYKTYVPNENWQIWQDDADNFGLPRNYCPNCGAKMKGENG